MVQHLNKIGIIQTAPIPGDFSNNLRSLVQGYRECLNKGADIVISSVYALSGLSPKDLLRRRSFLRQMEAAMETLAEELSVTDVPLVTGYALNPLLTPIDDEDEDFWEMDDGLLYDAEEGTPTMHETVILTPCLIHRGTLRTLVDGSCATVGKFLCHVTTSAQESLPEGTVDLIIHLPKEPWYNLSEEKERQMFCWESQMAQTPVICVHPVGTADGNLYGGGSALYLDNKVAGLLPYFEACSTTLRLNTTLTKNIPPPELISQVEKALVRGIRDTVHQNGFSGVCVPLDDDNSKLLVNLCVRALGSDNVVGISFENNSYPGIDCKSVDISPILRETTKLTIVIEDVLILQQRIQGSLLATFAQEKGLMLLSTLDRHALMMGEFTLYGQSNGYLAPLGNLYRVDLFLLARYIAEQETGMENLYPEPERSEEDRIIHELTEKNIAAMDILKASDNQKKENTVRFIQRKTIASALNRTQTPMTLFLSSPEEQLSLPITHRLND